MPEASSRIDLVCVEVIQESADVKTFWFERIDGAAFDYSAGQFITVEPAVDGERVRRCYTLSSSPTDGEGARRAAITVKAKPDGVVSNWLHAHLVAGADLGALAPGGTFTVSDRAASRYLFIAGGVGITPLISMARWLVAQGLADGQANAALSFVQCARSEEDLLFTHELNQWNREGLVRSFALPATATSGWAQEHGLITRKYLDRVCPDWTARKIYCCGPDPFMAHVRNMAALAGHDPEGYHEERFTVDLSSPVIPVDAGGVHASLVLVRSGHVLENLGDMSVLEAVRGVGIQIPASCEIGICGTCKIRVTAGQVIMNHQGGIGDDEIEAGWALACCSRPVGNVEIEV